MAKSNYKRQFLVALMVNFCSFGVGITLGWSSPVIQKLLDDELKDTPLDHVPSTENISWIGSISAIPALFAAYIAGYLASKIGRKWTLLSTSLFSITSWILLGTTTSLAQIYVARILQGIWTGFTLSIQAMYVGEIATDDYRGSLGSFMQLSIVLGCLYAFAIGPYTSYHLFNWLCCIIPIIFSIGFFFMPESPYYCITKGKTSQALASLRFLRGSSDEEAIQAEIDKIQMTVNEAKKNENSVMDIVTNKGNFRALIICMGLIWFQEFSGINGILLYCHQIFSKTGSTFDSSISAILVASVQVVASACTPFIADRLGRRLILLASAQGMVVFLLTTGAFFYLEHKQASIVEDITWLPVVSLIGFVTVYCIGFGSLPWIVLSEIFPNNVKSSAGAIVSSFNYLLAFIITRWFDSVDQALGTHWIFWIFSICCAAAYLFTYTMLFETKGLSFLEIQNKLNGRSAEGINRD